MEINESFDIYFRYIKYEKNLSLNTIKSYYNDLRLLGVFFKNKKISDTFEIDLDVFKKFLQFLDKYQFKNKSLARKFSSYINYFKFLEKKELLKDSISQMISMPKIEKKIYNFLSENEADKLLDSIGTETIYDLRDKSIFELFYSTGARINEITSITLKDIDLKNKEVRITGKGRKERIVFLNDFAAESLNNYIKVRNKFLYNKKNDSYKICNYLFLNKNGSALSMRFIRVLLDKYLKKAEINKKISPHGLRHSFATNMLQEGAGIREVQEILGHENISTTQIYTHLNFKKIKNDFDKYHPRAK